MGGIEKRKGNGRVQGVYGAEGYVSLNKSDKDKYQYANAITETNQNPSDGGFGGALPSGATRITEEKYNSSFEVGARAFIGVEVFIMPKVSLGGAFYWGISYEKIGESSITGEGWDAQSNSVKEFTRVYKDDANSSFNADVSTAGGSIDLNFYF